MKNEIKKNDDIARDRYVVPPVDITETEDVFLLTADMPGVKKEDIDITIDNEILELRGVITKASEDLSNHLKYAEFEEYNYYRKFNVGNNIDSEKVSAAVDGGVLTLTLPKKEELKPKKIDISVE